MYDSHADAPPSARHRRRTAAVRATEAGTIAVALTLGGVGAQPVLAANDNAAPGVETVAGLAPSLTGGRESSDAFDAAITTAKAWRLPVYIPEGTYQVNRHIVVDNVTVTGAGSWHSIVRGDVIVDQNADGLNLRRGVSDARVTNNFLRNLGDDGLAMWSHFVRSADGTPETSEEADQDHDNTYDHNTVIAPVLANGIAIYGGRDNSVTDNLVAETVREGGGLHAGFRHNSTRFSGMLDFNRNTTVRAGVLDLNWNFGVGALWFYSEQGPIDANVTVRNSSFLDSTYSAIMAVKGYPTANSVSNVHVQDVCIDGAGTYALQIQVVGSATFTNVTVRNPGVANVWRGDSFDIIDGGGNAGWQNDIRWNWPMDQPVPVAAPTNCG